MESAQRLAVIDVGTNSVKLLVADVAGRQITPVLEESKQTRLGAGFYQTHHLQPAAIAQTAEAVAQFSAKATENGASSTRVIATSATRDAVNSAQLLDAVHQSSGLRMEILSGKQEAAAVFLGVTSDPKWASIPALILDVGGGSTEFIVGENPTPIFSHSYGIGSVRLLEQLQPADPPGLAALAACRAWLKNFLDEKVASELEPALRKCSRSPQLIGTGGTVTILARMEGKMEDFNRAAIEATIIRRDQIREHLERQWQMTLAQRQQLTGLPPKRADVILMGMAIYEAIMERFGFEELGISTRGLRYWALLHG